MAGCSLARKKGKRTVTRGLQQVSTGVSLTKEFSDQTTASIAEVQGKVIVTSNFL